ncbi:hypothetical protein HF319_10985 [Xanthomonas sp. Kuri4-1]
MRGALGLLVFLLPGIAMADTTQTGKVTRVVVESNYASIWLESQPSNEECAADGRWVIDFTNDKLSREKYSALLAAASSRLTVSLHYVSSEGCGGFGAKRVYYIDTQY